jgi:hypothetical protein
MVEMLPAIDPTTGTVVPQILPAGSCILYAKSVITKPTLSSAVTQAGGECGGSIYCVALNDTISQPVELEILRAGSNVRLANGNGTDTLNGTGRMM